MEGVEGEGVVVAAVEEEVVVVVEEAEEGEAVEETQTQTEE